MKTLTTRLKHLEAHASPDVLGWLEPAVDPDLVTVSDSKETMSLAAFTERYPNGTLVRWEEGDTQ